MKNFEVISSTGKFLGFVRATSQGKAVEIGQAIFGDYFGKSLVTVRQVGV